jgi:hypothetical protein
MEAIKIVDATGLVQVGEHPPKRFTQDQLLEMFKQFKEAIWADSESERDQMLYRVVCYCLYQLIEHKGPTLECQHLFSRGFSDSISLEI